MNKLMKNEDYFDVLLRNFRLLEACGFISALVNKELLDEKRGQCIEEFLRTYNYIIINNLLNEKGIAVLEIKDDMYSDLNVEKIRISKLIKDNCTNEHTMLNDLLIAYVALVSEDLIRLEQQYSIIIDKIGKISSLDPDIINNLGTYDCFNYLSGIVLKIYNLQGPILMHLNRYAPRVAINRILEMG